MTKPSRVDEPGLAAPLRACAACLASTLGSSETDLMSTRAQRLSGTVMTAMPVAASGVGLAARSVERASTISDAAPADREREVAPRDAARHLQVARRPSRPDCGAPLRADDARSGRCAIGVAMRSSSASAAGARGGASRRPRMPSRDLADLVDSVGELDSRDPRCCTAASASGRIAAVDVRRCELILDCRAAPSACGAGPSAPCR